MKIKIGFIAIAANRTLMAGLCPPYHEYSTAPQGDYGYPTPVEPQSTHGYHMESSARGTTLHVKSVQHLKLDN